MALRPFELFDGCFDKLPPLLYPTRGLHEGLPLAPCSALVAPHRLLSISYLPQGLTLCSCGTLRGALALQPLRHVALTGVWVEEDVFFDGIGCARHEDGRLRHSVCFTQLQTPQKATKHHKRSTKLFNFCSFCRYSFKVNHTKFSSVLTAHVPFNDTRRFIPHFKAV